MSVNRNGRGGIIANVSSVAGIAYSKRIPVYTGTKFGIVGFSKSIAVSAILDPGSKVRVLTTFVSIVIIILKGRSQEKWNKYFNNLSRRNKYNTIEKRI